MQAYVRGWLVRRHLDEVIFGWAAYDHAVRELKSFCEENSLTMHQLFDELDIDQNGTLVINKLESEYEFIYKAFDDRGVPFTVYYKGPLTEFNY